MDSMLYNEGAMLGHASNQDALVALMTDAQTRSLNNIQGTVAPVWTKHGSNAAQNLMAAIRQRFTNGFETISRHSCAIRKVAANSTTTDHAVAASFNGLM